MKPYYEHDGITIYHGDCREVLPSLVGTVDALVTDPPYGLGDRMSGGTWGGAAKYADMREWDVAPEDALVSLLLATAPNIAIWGGNHFRLPPSRGWLIWDKQNAVPTMADVEMAWTNVDRPAKRISLPVGRHDWGHPSEKPLALMLWTLSLIPGDTVLDPFMGSGTTLRAAKDLRRHCVGVEVNERYCEIAAQRLNQQVLDFGEAA